MNDVDNDVDRINLSYFIIAHSKKCQNSPPTVHSFSIARIIEWSLKLPGIKISFQSTIKKSEKRVEILARFSK